MPHAIGEGMLRLGSAELPCAMLSTGQAVLTKRAVLRALSGGPDNAHLERQAERIYAKRGMNPVGPAIVFSMLQGGTAHGFEARVLVDLCDALVDLKLDGKLHPKQEPALARARIILSALGRAAIETMVADACGVRGEPGDTEARFNEALREAVAAYAAKTEALRERIDVLEAAGSNGGVIGERFAQERIIGPLQYAAGLLAAARGKRFSSTRRTLHNLLEREARYGKNGERWRSYPAVPEKVSTVLAFVQRTQTNAEREHAAWMKSRPSGQRSLFDFAA